MSNNLDAWLAGAESSANNGMITIKLDYNDDSNSIQIESTEWRVLTTENVLYNAKLPAKNYVLQE